MLVGTNASMALAIGSREDQILSIARNCLLGRERLRDACALARTMGRAHGARPTKDRQSASRRPPGESAGSTQASPRTCVVAARADSDEARCAHRRRLFS